MSDIQMPQKEQKNKDTGQPEADGFISMKTSRRRILTLCGAGLVALPVIGFLAPRVGTAKGLRERRKAGPAHEAIYGTKANPAYQIEKKLVTGHTTYEQDIDKRLDLLSKLEKGVESVEEHIISARETNSVQIEGIKVDKTLLMETLKKISKPLEWLNRYRVQYSMKRSSEWDMAEYQGKVSEYGDPVEYVAELFKDLTGKELPSSIKYEMIEFKGEDTIGEAFFRGEKVRYENMHYALLLINLGHEISHLLSQQEEDIFFHGSARLSKWEEAYFDEISAYAGEMTVLSAIKDEELKKTASEEMSFKIRSFVEAFFSGDNEIHRETLTIADAAVSVFEDPGKAYNYLQSTDTISSAIMQKVEENRNKFCRAEEIRKDLTERVLNLSGSLEGWKDIIVS